MKKADPIGQESLEQEKSRRKPKPLFEFEGRYEEVDPRGLFDDENINAAIEFRTQKSKHTDFFFKLHDLKERIEVFNKIFGSKQPKYMHLEY